MRCSKVSLMHAKPQGPFDRGIEQSLPLFRGILREQIDGIKKTCLDHFDCVFVTLVELPRDTLAQII